MHVYITFFLKDMFFIKLTLFFVLKNEPIQTKIIPISESTFKNKGNVGQDTFLEFADISC